MTKVFNRILKVYTTMLQKHSILVQSAQTGIIMAMGDVIAQSAEKRSLRKIDLIRTSHFFTLGMGLVGPAASLWYKVLSSSFGNAGTTTAFKKVAADQLFCAPVFMAFFMVALNTLQGHDWEQIKKEFDAKYFDLLMANYKIWPAVQLINFYMVPLNYQVLFVQTIGLFWNAFLSWKLAQNVKD